MAKQKSFVKFKGTMDDLTFYIRKGRYLVRKKGGVDRERILNDPNYERVRENMSEFAAASKVATTFRKSLNSLIKQLGGTTVQARLMRIFRKIINKGAGKAGQRAITLLPNKLLFTDFQFNEEKRFDSIFVGFHDPPTVDANRNVVSWELPVFDIKNDLIKPEGTTHYRFVMATVVVSDHALNEGTETYMPLTDAAFIKRSVTFTDYLEADVPLAAPIAMETDLGLAEALPDTAISITVVGVFFYKWVDREYLTMKSEQALQVLAVA
ncbi:MAG: hypothetical protein R2781_06350 [Flavobacteriaceae bacterium]